MKPHEKNAGRVLVQAHDLVSQLGSAQLEDALHVVREIERAIVRRLKVEHAAHIASIGPGLLERAGVRP